MPKDKLDKEFDLIEKKIKFAEGEAVHEKRMKEDYEYFKSKTHSLSMFQAANKSWEIDCKQYGWDVSFIDVIAGK